MPHRPARPGPRPRQKDPASLRVSLPPRPALAAVRIVRLLSSRLPLLSRGAALLALAGAAALAPARDLAAQDKLCPRCGSAGRVANVEKNPKLAALEAKVLRCSVAVAADKQGRALPFVPCDKCLAPSKRAAAQQEFDVLAAAVDEWMAKQAAIDRNLRPRDPLVHVETEHFLLVFGLPKVTLESKQILKAHEAAHLYADRLEEFYDWFQKLVGYTDEAARVLKHQVFLLADMRTLMKAANDYAHNVTDRSTRVVGDPSVYCTWLDKGVYPEDRDFHRHVVHNVSHQMQGVFFSKVWLVERAGWLDEGLAHVSEQRLFEVAGNSCNVEGTEEDMPDDRWQPVVRKLVEQNKSEPFADLRLKRADQLGGRDHLLAWSYTDFLLARDPSRMPELIRRLKQDVDVRDALRDLYGLSAVGIDEAWAAWVRENYELEP